MTSSMEKYIAPRRSSFARSAAVVAGFAAGGLMLAACSTDDETTRDDAGAIVESGEISAFSINVGDCIVGAASGEVSGFEGVPCDQPHDNEVYHTFDLPDGEFPGDAVIEARGTEDCLAEFEPFVGLDFASSIYGVTWLFPTAGSWAQGDREIACLINNFDGTQKTGSARGTGL